jgi:cytoskeletal protein CcmA (bactofilin family)/ribosomal protein S27E
MGQPQAQPLQKQQQQLEAEPQPSALLPTDPVEPAQTLPGFGNMMMGVDGEPTTSSRPEKEEPERRVMPEKASEAPPAPGPITVSTFQKMKEQGYYRQQYFKDVECFDCRHKFKVGRSAKTTQCPTCGVHISLEDLDINLASTQPILTRGDVMVRKNGNISTSQIMCRDLKVFGMISGQIECSGDLLLRTSGTIIGEIRCKRFIVEKGSELKFHNVIYADDVEIHARVVGNIQCSGRVLIGAQGWIHGDVTARSVSIEPGGQLDGAMNILRSTPQKQPAAPLPQAPAEKSELVS